VNRLPRLFNVIKNFVLGIRDLKAASTSSLDGAEQDDPLATL
jgi:hypothetical protein